MHTEIGKCSLKGYVIRNSSGYKSVMKRIVYLLGCKASKEGAFPTSKTNLCLETSMHTVTWLQQSYILRQRTQDFTVPPIFITCPLLFALEEDEEDSEKEPQEKTCML